MTVTQYQARAGCSHQSLSLRETGTDSTNVRNPAEERAHLSAPTTLSSGPIAVPAPANPAIAVPEADPTFSVDELVSRLLRAVAVRTGKGEIVNVLLTGPTGTGKSSLPREFAAWWQRPFLTVHCQLVTEQGDWWGTREMSPQHGTYFRRAALLDAVETAGCVILLDEANRTHPENLNALFGFLDHRRRAWLPLLNREVIVAPGVTFFVTLNEGMDYLGTNLIDRALRDRISNTIVMDYPAKRVEVNLLVKRAGVGQDVASKLVDLAHTVRNNPKLAVAVSTRQLLECAALVREGLSLADAVLFSMVNGAAENVDRKALLQSLQMTGAIPGGSAEWQWDEEE